MGSVHYNKMSKQKGNHPIIMLAKIQTQFYLHRAPIVPSIRNTLIITTFWHRAKIYFTCIKAPLHIFNVLHLTKISEEILCTMIKRCKHYTKNSRHYQILAQGQNLLQMHQAPIVHINCTKIEKNLSNHVSTIIKKSKNPTKRL